MDKIINGSDISQQIKSVLKKRIEELTADHKRIPKLVVINVGNNEASLSYVRGKEKACTAIGMQSELVSLNEDCSEYELINVINRCNNDDTVDGILVQLPLPKHINTQVVLNQVAENKDVDGFHPTNIGNLFLQQPTVNPCTPQGIMYLLESIGYTDLSGLHAVVIGRSNIVGKPLALMLLDKNATVTLTHSKTKNITTFTKQADVLIVAMGKPLKVTSDWIKSGAIVIDVGIHRLQDNSMCGDVDFDNVINQVSYITPVPKGVGPMTIAVLLKNTVEAYIKHEEKKHG